MSTATAEPRSASGSLVSALGALFTLTVRQHTHGRRLLVLGVLFLLPCVLAIVLRSLARPAPPEALEGALLFWLLPHGLAPLTALLYAAGIVGDEVEEQTLTYLLLRPIPRWALFATKLLATWCVTTALVSVAVVALYLACFWGTPDLTESVLPNRLPRFVAVMALAQLAYCGLFGFLGVFTKRSLLAGIAYIVSIEGVLANIQFVLRDYTVAFNVRVLILRWLELPADSVRRLTDGWQIDDVNKLPTGQNSAVGLAALGVAAAIVSALYFRRKEFRVKTPDGN